MRRISPALAVGVIILLVLAVGFVLGLAVSVTWARQAGEVIAIPPGERDIPQVLGRDRGRV